MLDFRKVEKIVIEEMAILNLFEFYFRGSITGRSEGFLLTVLRDHSWGTWRDIGCRK